MVAIARILLFGGIVGKILGVAREIVSAWIFGIGHVAVAYRLSQAAFFIPLQGLASDALNGGFTPRYAMHRELDPLRANALFAGLHVLMFAASTLVAVMLYAFASQWVRLLAPGFDAATATIATQMLQVLGVAMPAYVLTGIYASAELAAGRGELAALRASVQSVGLIFGMLFAWMTQQPVVIAIGFVLSQFGLAIWGARTIARTSLPFWPQREHLPYVREELFAVWRVFRVLLWVPVFLQVHFIVEKRVASIVHPGAVAALDYARFISDTVVLLLAMPFGLAGLASMPTMTERDFREMALRSLRLQLFVSLPLSALFAVHAELLVRFLFARGAFDEQSVAITALILSGIAAGIWGQVVAYAGIKYLNARGATRSVLVITAASVVANVTINVVLSNWLGVLTLGVSSMVSGTLIGLLVLWRLRLLGALGADLFSLCASAFLYAGIWFVAPPTWRTSLFPTVSMAFAFWTLMLIGIPRHRRAVRDGLTLLRRT